MSRRVEAISNSSSRECFPVGHSVEAQEGTVLAVGATARAYLILTLVLIAREPRTSSVSADGDKGSGVQAGRALQMFAKELAVAHHPFLGDNVLDVVALLEDGDNVLRHVRRDLVGGELVEEGEAVFASTWAALARLDARCEHGADLIDCDLWCTCC